MVPRLHPNNYNQGEQVKADILEQEKAGGKMDSVLHDFFCADVIFKEMHCKISQSSHENCCILFLMSVACRSSIGFAYFSTPRNKKKFLVGSILF